MTDETIVEPSVEPVAVELAVEPPIEPTAAPKEVPAALLARISKEAAGRREADQRAAVFEKRALDAEALAARLSATAPKGGPELPPVSPAARGESDADRQAAIRAEAQNQRFYEDTVDVRNRGMAVAGQKFIEALNVLGAANFTTNNEAVADVIAAVGKENAHQMLIDLSKDFEKADALAQMSSRQRIAELTRMSLAKPTETAVSAVDGGPQPPPKQVSKAPPPPPPVQTSTTKVKTAYSDEMDDDEFTACWKERLEKRGLRR